MKRGVTVSRDLEKTSEKEGRKSTIGGLLGNLIHFDTKGLDFVMTAMFVVIFMEQWLKEKHHCRGFFHLSFSTTKDRHRSI